MMNRGVQKVLSMLLILCLAMGISTGAVAQTTADFEALMPVMDLVCAASQYSPNAPESIGGADSELTLSFIDAFMKVGQIYGANVGVSASMLSDTAAQAELLGKIFAAQLPELQAVSSTDELSGYIGFQPVTVNSGTDGTSVQIIGEMYLADKPMSEMTEADIANISWIDRAVFIFQYDETALNGFRLTGFSVGTDLTYEQIMMAYDETITVEYESNLGFMLHYPAIFGDEIVVEDEENGISATLPDGSASFFATRMPNENGASLADYVSIVSNGINGSISTVNETIQNGTVTYTTEDGFIVFTVFIVTEEYIYQAEFSYHASKMAEYGMYTSYLENSFVVTELSQG